MWDIFEEVFDIGVDDMCEVVGVCCFDGFNGLVD